MTDPAKLQTFNVSLAEVTEAARAANTNAAGGFLVNPDRELLIRGIGRISSIEELKQSVVTARNGKPVLLSDVADVQIGAALQRGDGSFNGQRAVVVMVNKQPQADTSTDLAGLVFSAPKGMRTASVFCTEMVAIPRVATGKDRCQRSSADLSNRQGIVTAICWRATDRRRHPC